jgi:hypothetical protein
MGVFCIVYNRSKNVSPEMDARKRARGGGGFY